jgi:hypothetical protein
LPRRLTDDADRTRDVREPLTPELRDALEAEMLRTLRAVESRVSALCVALSQSLSAKVIVRTGEGGSGRMEDACTAIGTLTIESDDPRGTPSLIGVIGVPAHVVRLAEAVNEAKADMKACWSHAQRYARGQPKVGAPGERETVTLARLLLRRIGQTNLSLNAAYRKIPVLPKRPTRVVFHVAQTRNIYRVTRKTLKNLLATCESPRAAADLQTLEDCPDVQFAAIVSKSYENHRANVWFDGLDTRGRGLIQVRAELPILYPLGRGAASLEVVFPKAGQGSKRRKRADAIVDDEPFLPSISAHRYKPRKPRRDAVGMARRTDSPARSDR